MAIQLATARQSLENVLQDISDVPAATFLQWCQYLSDTVYRITSDIEPGRYITEANLSVIAGQSTYTLPTDFLNHQSFGTGLFKTNNQLPSATKLGITGFGASSVGYYIQNNSFVLTPTPQANGLLINRYIPKSPTYLTTADYFTLDKLSTGREIVPDAYLQYVQNSLVALYEVWDQDAPLESLADQRFVRTLDELARNISRPPLAWGLPDFSPMY